MTFDRECKLCGDICYQPIYGKTKINDYIPEYLKFSGDEIKQISSKDIKNKVIVVKPFRYWDCRCVCNECWAKWSKMTSLDYLKFLKRGSVVREWRK